jgi:hypothetical protein
LKQNVNWNQTLPNHVEVCSKMKNMRKDDRGHKLMVQYSQMLVTIHPFALFLHRQSTLSKVRKMK